MLNVIENTEDLNTYQCAISATDTSIIRLMMDWIKKNDTKQEMIKENKTKV